MARYFKFHSVSDLETESRRLGLDLRFSSDFSPLFRPVAIGPLRAGNAIPHGISSRQRIPEALGLAFAWRPRGARRILPAIEARGA